LFASCDGEGAVKLWDLRNTTQALHVETGASGANKLAFDPSGNILAVASNSGNILFLNLNEGGKVKTEIRVGDGSCQTVLYDKSGDYVVATGNDGTFKIFQQ
jgi:WD40 repeat protein